MKPSHNRPGTYRPRTFRYGVIKQLAKELGISQSAATMRIRYGNTEALEIALRIHRDMEKRERRVLSSMSKRL